MDISTLLRTLVKAKSCLLISKKNTLNSLNLKKQKMAEPPPRSIAQVISKYSPRSSAKLHRLLKPKAKQEALLTFCRVIRRSLKINWMCWARSKARNSIMSAKTCSTTANQTYRRKLIKSKTVMFETMNSKKVECMPRPFVNRQNTIIKLDATMKLSKSVRTATRVLLLSAFEAVKIRSKAEKLHEKLTNVLKNVLKFFKQPDTKKIKHRNLEIARAAYISIARQPSNPKIFSVTQESSFSLGPTRNLFCFPVKLSNRYLNSEEL